MNTEICVVGKIYVIKGYNIVTYFQLYFIHQCCIHKVIHFDKRAVLALHRNYSNREQKS